MAGFAWAHRLPDRQASGEPNRAAQSPHQPAVESVGELSDAGRRKGMPASADDLSTSTAPQAHLR